MTTIQINLPDDLVSKLSKLNTNAEAFIISLLRSRIKTSEKELTLADEYRLAGIENKQLMQDFKNVDLENWEDVLRNK